MTMDEAIKECNRIWDERKQTMKAWSDNGIRGHLRDCLPDDYEGVMQQAMRQVMRERGYLRNEP